MNSSRLKGNPHNIFVMGHSAGALIAAMLSVNPEYLNKVGVSFKIINGMIGLAGTYDFLPEIVDPITKKVFSKVDLQATQPNNFVTEGLPAFLLITGENDTSVLPKNSINLARKLKTSDNKAVINLYKNLNHRDVLLTLSPIFSYKAPILREINKFIVQVSQGPTLGSVDLSQS